jgi:hypothetical protein
MGTGLASSEVRRSSRQAQLAKVDRDVEQFLDRIANAQLPSVVTAYENRIRRLDRLEHKKAVLKLAFADRLTYVRNEGLRTPNLALPFKVLADLKSSESKMARPAEQTVEACDAEIAHKYLEE